MWKIRKSRHCEHRLVAEAAPLKGSGATAGEYPATRHPIAVLQFTDEQ
jgi:hypothetical protein